jgi:hypothetical protein
MDTFTPAEDALVALSAFLRIVNNGLYLRRLRVVERARYRAFLRDVDAYEAERKARMMMRDKP